MIASEILNKMNIIKITNVCVFSKKNKNKTLGVFIFTTY